MDECPLADGAVGKDEGPFSILLVIFVLAFFHAAVCALEHCGAIKLSMLWCKLREVPFLRWVCLNRALLSFFLSSLESTHLQYLLLFVDQEANAVWREFFIRLQKLAPVETAFILPVGHLVALDELRTLQILISNKDLQIKHEWLVLANTVLHVAIDLNNLSFHAPQCCQMVFYFCLSRIFNPWLFIDGPKVTLLNLAPGLNRRRRLSRLARQWPQIMRVCMTFINR